MNHVRFAPALAGAVLAASAAPVLAGGLYVYEADPVNSHSSRAAWQNPAAMTGLDKASFNASAAVVIPVMKFDVDTATVAGDDGNNAGIVGGVPEMSYVRPLSPNWWVGVSVVGLFGGGVDYGDDFVGRYSVTKVEMSGVGLSPSVAYKFNDAFSIGAGVSITRSQLDQKIAFRNLGAPDGRVHFDELDDTGVQPFTGFTWRLSPRAQLGFVYRAEMDIELEGSAKFTNIAPNINPKPDFERDVQVDWTNAQTIEVGLEYVLTPTDILNLTGTWEDWSVFDDNVIAVDAVNLANVQPITLQRNWKDTYSIGARYLHLIGHQALSVGVQYVSSPVDDADRTFDLPFDEYVKVSFGYLFEPHGRFTYALGGAVLFSGNAAVDQTFHRGTPLQSQVAGEFDTNMVFVLGGSLRYSFD